MFENFDQAEHLKPNTASQQCWQPKREREKCLSRGVTKIYFSTFSCFSGPRKCRKSHIFRSTKFFLICKVQFFTAYEIFIFFVRFFEKYVPVFASFDQKTLKNWIFFRNLVKIGKCWDMHPFAEPLPRNFV